MSPEPPSVASPKRPIGRGQALVFRALGVMFVGLATAGVFLPLLPTTPFLLLAVWAFARGSPELRARLYADRRFGPLLRDWDERRAIPRKAKALAIIGMTAGFALVLWRSSGPLLPAIAGVIILGAAAFVLTRPN